MKPNEEVSSTTVNVHLEPQESTDGGFPRFFAKFTGRFTRFCKTPNVFFCQLRSFLAVHPRHHTIEVNWNHHQSPSLCQILRWIIVAPIDSTISFTLHEFSQTLHIIHRKMHIFNLMFHPTICIHSSICLLIFEFQYFLAQCKTFRIVVQYKAHRILVLVPRNLPSNTRSLVFAPSPCSKSHCVAQ